MTKVAGRYLSALLLACAGLAISSCAADNKPEQAAERFAEKVTQRVCGIFESCCLAANFPYQEQSCEAINGPKIRHHFDAQVFLGAELDSQAAQRCLDAIGQVNGTCPVDRGSYLSDACTGLFKGTVPVGGECDPGHGCATTPDAPLNCVRALDERSNYEYSGVCVAVPPRFVHNRLGQACNQTCTDESGPCVSTGIAGDTGSAEGTCFASDGLFCGMDSKQCQRRAVSGEPCGPDMPCATGTFCNSDDAKCAPTRPLGASCTDSSQCGAQNFCFADTCQSQAPRASAAQCAGQPPTSPQSPVR